MICLAALTRVSASLTAMPFPLCAFTSSMKACSGPHASAGFLSCSAARAAVSLARSELRIPRVVASPLTTVIKSPVCSAAPFTWMVKRHELVLFAASEALHPAVESPAATVGPDGGVHATLVAEQLSDTPGAYVTTAPDGPVASTTIGAGHVSCGGVASRAGFTVTSPTTPSS